MSMLEVCDLQAGYGRLQVLWDVSLSVAQGEFVALIGANGAGKTTLLRAIAGILPLAGGSVRFLGAPLAGQLPHQISRAGLAYITEDLNLFEGMTVLDNLLLGAYTRRGRAALQAGLEQVYELFPRLAERRVQLAGTLSGGERRMLAIGRGLMLAPNILLIDEPSLGLAPRLVAGVFSALQALHARGLTLLLVEQNVSATLKITDRAYVLEQGRIRLDGSSRALLENNYLKDAYLGQR